jgi:hypothetical protein
VPLEVISVSRHAQQRYRIQHPDALISDIFFAVHRAIPVDMALSFALAGRQPRSVDDSYEEHRLHVTGCGVFVICALPEEGRGFVKTYLRFGEKQQQLARSWFLDPLKPLLRAFELGFDAARAPGAPALAAQAVDASGEALTALSARLVAPPVPERPPVRRPTPDSWPTSFSPAAVQQLLAHQRIYSDLEISLKKWQPMEAELLDALLAYSHIPPIPCVGGYVEPLGRIAALLVETDDGPQVATAITVPLALRDALPVDPSVLPSEPDAEPTPLSEVIVVEASELTVSSWSPRAVREASEQGFAHVPVAWITQLSPVEAEQVRQLAVALRWTLQAGSTYAARRSREHVLLLRRAEDAPSSTVVRCSRLPPELC